MLFVSTKTVRRRIEEFNINPKPFSNLSNEDLDAVTSEILSEFPNCGSKRMAGFSWPKVFEFNRHGYVKH